MGRHQNKEQHKQHVKDKTHAPWRPKVKAQWTHWLRGFTATLGISVLLVSGTTQAIASNEEDPTTSQQSQVSSLSMQNSDNEENGQPTAPPADPTATPEMPATDPPVPNPPAADPSADGSESDSVAQDDSDAGTTPDDNNSDDTETEGDVDEDGTDVDADIDADKPKEKTSVTSTSASGTTTLRITKIGDRTTGSGLTSGAGINGAVFGVFETKDDDTPFETCTTAGTNPAGVCDIVFTHKSNERNVWVKEITPAPGWYPTAPYGTGIWSSDKNITPYEFRMKTGSGSNNVVKDVTADASRPDVSFSGAWVNSRVNPDFPAVCGLSIAMVFDTSGSISRQQMTRFKAAAQNFVKPGALGLTPSQVTMFSFSTNAQKMNGGNPFNLSSQTGSDAAVNEIAGLPSSGNGSTNWDQAFRVVNDTGSYDMVLFLTDGDPTTHGYNQGSGTYVNFVNVEQAAMSANVTKTRVGPAGTHTKVLGVGVGLSYGSNYNLAAITGPDENVDYFLAANFDLLSAKLQEIATINCASTLTVVKEVQDSDGNVIADTPPNEGITAGWDFTVAGEVIAGGSATQATTSAGTNFVMDFGSEFTPQTVTVTELVEPGHTFVGARCTGTADGDTTPTANGFDVSVMYGLITTCTVVNRIVPVEASVSVEKTWIITDSSGEEVLRTAHIPERARDVELPEGLSAQLALSGPLTLTTNNQSWGSERGGYIEGGSAIIDETTGIDVNLLPGCELTSQKLTTEDGESANGSSFPLPHNATLSAGINTFEITNTVACSTSMTLLKHVDDGNAQPSEWDLTATLVDSDPTEGTTVAGAETKVAANTFEVRDGQDYLLTEALADPNATLAFKLDRLEKCELDQGAPVNCVTVDVAEAASVDLGQHEVYRFVNKPLPLFAIPLTGGLSTDFLTVSGGLAAVLALLIGVWYWRYSTRITRLI